MQNYFLDQAASQPRMVPLPPQRDWSRTPEKQRRLTAALGITLLLCTGFFGLPAPPCAADSKRPQKAVVLLFIARDCPISNAYAPEIKRILARYTPQKIAFELVYPDPDTSPSAAQAHAKEYGYTCPLRVDPKHLAAQKYGATVTPEAIVLDQHGKLIYRGRIDDRYAAFGQQRFLVTHHDLRDALDAVLTGKPVRTPRTTAIGCFI